MGAAAMVSELSAWGFLLIYLLLLWGAAAVMGGP